MVSVPRLAEMGLVKCHTSVRQVLNAPTYYTTLAPNDVLPDPNFCNQCKPWNPIALNLLLKAFAQLVDAWKCRFAPNTPDPLWAKDKRHLIRFERNSSIHRSLTVGSHDCTSWVWNQVFVWGCWFLLSWSFGLHLDKNWKVLICGNVAKKTLFVTVCESCTTVE